jgi:hexosaminidase
MRCTIMSVRCTGLFVCLVSVLAGQDLKLIPEPRFIERGQGALALQSPVRIALASKSEEDRLATSLLVEELREIHHLDASINAGSGGSILIGRPGDPEIDAGIARRKLDLSALDHEESYLLSVNSSGAFVAAKTTEGIFYGVQTLRQLITMGGQVPAVKIADWPALRYRAMSVDLSRGPVLTEEQMKSAIRTAAEFKMNMLQLYLEHVFPYSHSPFAAPEGGQVTPEEIKRLDAYARRYHVDLVPLQQFFGHLHNMLKFELYAGMGEIPHGGVLSPTNERTYDWIRQASLQLAEAFSSRFLFAGSDETWELGEGQSRELAKSIGVGGVYLSHMQHLAEILRPLGKRILFPSDIVLKYPEIIPKLPKELIVVAWNYAPRDDYSSYTDAFRKNRLNYFVCTGVHNWNRVFPNFSDTRVNNNGFAREAKKQGALGLIATHWGDDGEALFNLTWYGFVFSAAASWQPGTVDVEQFDRAFDWAFYRNNQDQTFAKAIRSLAETHNLLKSVGAGEATDSLFWVDPFSRYGSETVRKAFPAASKLRLLAEQAAVDLSAGREKARHHRDTVAFLEFAAKRLDYLGMKIQFSKEMADCYRTAQADPATVGKIGRSLYPIYGATNGMIADLRDYINEVKLMYRDTWLSENRPYWLENVLVRYEDEALYWVRKQKLFDGAAQEQRATKSLPAPEQLGLYLP